MADVGLIHKVFLCKARTYTQRTADVKQNWEKATCNLSVYANLHAMAQKRKDNKLQAQVCTKQSDLLLSWVNVSLLAVVCAAQELA